MENWGWEGEKEHLMFNPYPPFWSRNIWTLPCVYSYRKENILSTDFNKVSGRWKVWLQPRNGCKPVNVRKYEFMYRKWPEVAENRKIRQFKVNQLCLKQQISIMSDVKAADIPYKLSHFLFSATSGHFRYVKSSFLLTRLRQLTIQP